MRSFRPFVLILMLVALLVGCAGTGKIDPNYQAQLQFVEQQAAAERQQFTSIAQTAERCTSDACVTQVAALAALAAAGGRGSAPTVQPFRKQFHPAWGLLGSLVPSLANAAVSWHQSDNARDTSLAQYGFLGGVIRDVAASPALQTPNITVGGDYVPGSQHIGDAVGGDYITGHVGDAVSVGRDQIGGDQHVGDAIGRDVVGGDRIDNSGNLGTDNRIDSPGPISTDNSGDECDGIGCQGVVNPPPEEDGSGG